MKIYTEIKPRFYKAATKDLVYRQVLSSRKIVSYSISKYGSGMSDRNGHFIMINYEKRRSKRGVYKAHWIAHVYLFPITLLAALNIKVTQKTRNFVIEPIK